MLSLFRGGVKPEPDVWASASRTPPLRTQNEELLAARLGRVPAHARVLGQPEEVAAGTVEQHLLGKGQAPGRPGRAGADFINVRRAGGAITNWLPDSSDGSRLSSCYTPQT